MAKDTITLNDKEFSVRERLFNAACNVEEEIGGRNLIEILRDAATGDFTAMRALLRHTLADGGGAPPSGDEIGEIVAQQGFKRLTPMVTAAYEPLFAGRKKA